MRLRPWWLAAGLAVLLIAGVAGPAAAQSAQAATGRIDVVVEDATGARLPGVNIELAGPMDLTAVTDARGEARFLNLNLGIYQLRATLQGFSEYRNTNIPVVAGGTVVLPIKLAVAGQQETVLVTAAAPVIDTRRQGTATNVTLEELQNIPTARDPWVVMQSVPGVVMDRVNVGGSESGQQANYMGKGSTSSDTTWNMDGVPVTDMSSLSSPFYYDFDMFQEMNVVTGGSDPKSATGGVQLNFILKSGTNNFHGNGRIYFENESLQSKNIDPNNTELALVMGTTKKGNRTDQYGDYGGDVGGPIIKDKLWFWAAYGQTDVRIKTLNDASDRTLLRNVSFKTQGQITKDMRGSFTYYYANKLKWGRGAGPTRPQETAWNQTGPSNFYKGELNYVFGNNLFLSGKYAYMSSTFMLDPIGGIGAGKEYYCDDSGVYHNSYLRYNTDRPQQSLLVDGNYFRGSHEIKFGFSWRKAEVHSSTVFPGTKVVTWHDGYPNMLAQVWGDYFIDTASRFTSFYAGDTISLDRMTVNVGLRYDRQVASVLDSKAPATPGFETLLPAITAPGIDAVETFSLWAPRAGVSYALDESKKTQLRASYGIFASQLGAGHVGFMSASQYRYVYYAAVDLNGNKVADKNEMDLTTILGYAGFDPANPSKVDKSPHQVGNYSVPKTHEVIVGIDRELMPNFGVSASLTYRYLMDFNWRPLIGVSITDYVRTGTLYGTLPDGRTYGVPYYALKASAVPPGGGFVETKNEGYHEQYWGFEVTATKRMSDRWMARFGFSTNDWRQYWEGQPTNNMDPTPDRNNPLVNGGQLIIRSTGSGKSNVWMALPKYQFILNGAYQAPYDIDLGLSMLVRQGYPAPWHERTATGDPLVARKYVMITPDVDEGRLPAVTTVDFRVGKTFKMKRANVIVDLDIFNLLNSATILQREYDKSRTGPTGFNAIREIMQPRIARIGLRVTF